MAYQLTQQIQVLNKHSSIDLLYGPYFSIEQACAAIPQAIRNYGKTLLIGDDTNGYNEYWWKDKLTDDGLILKITSNEQVQSNWNETDETSPAYIKNKPEIPKEFTIKEASMIVSTGGADFEYTVIAGVNEGDTIIWKNNKITYKVNPDIKDDSKGITDCELLLDHLYKICVTEYDNMSYQYIIHITGPSRQSDWLEEDNTSADFIKNKPFIPTVNNGALTLKAGDNEQVFRANQSSNVTFEIKASDLGLGIIFTYCGVTTTTLTDDSTTNPILIDGDYYTATAGCVVFSGDKEYVWNGSKWEELGYPITVDLSGYKEKQTAKQINIPDNQIIDRIDQNKNGEITCNYRDIPVAGKDTLGYVKTSSSITDSTDYTPCPIIEGVPYFKQTTIADTGLYVNVLRTNPGHQWYNGDVYTANLTAFKENDIILIPDTFNTTLYCHYRSGDLFSILYPNRLYKITKHYDTDKDGNVIYFAKPFGVEYQKPSVHECEITPNNDDGEGATYAHHVLLDLAHEVNLVNITEHCKLRFLLDNKIIKPGSIDYTTSNRFLYKKFKIVATNKTEEDKYIYFDLEDENPFNDAPPKKISHKSNVQDRTFTISSNSIRILYITIVNINSLVDTYGEISYFVDYYGNA